MGQSERGPRQAALLFFMPPLGALSWEGIQLPGQSAHTGVTQ